MTGGKEALLRPFVAFCDDFLVDLEDGMSSPEAAVFRTARRWYSFWTRESSELSQQAMRGLVGELSFLEFLVRGHGPKALASWVGPEGQDHDFQSGHEVAFEVKTSSSIPYKIECNLNQLDRGLFWKLFLVCFKLQKSDEGISLPELVARVSGSLKGDDAALETFDEKLALVGYSQKKKLTTASTDSRLSPAEVFPVVDGFPAITLKFRAPAGHARAGCALRARDQRPGIFAARRFRIERRSAAALRARRSPSLFYPPVNPPDNGLESPVDIVFPEAQDDPASARRSAQFVDPARHCPRASCARTRRSSTALLRAQGSNARNSRRQTPRLVLSERQYPAGREDETSSETAARDARVRAGRASPASCRRRGCVTCSGFAAPRHHVGHARIIVVQRLRLRARCLLTGACITSGQYRPSAMRRRLLRQQEERKVMFLVRRFDCGRCVNVPFPARSGEGLCAGEELHDTSDSQRPSAAVRCNMRQINAG